MQRILLGPKAEKCKFCAETDFGIKKWGFILIKINLGLKKARMFSRPQKSVY